MRVFAILISLILLFNCKGSKPNSPVKKDCDTCPSLSNEGKIDKPHVKKKKNK